MSNLENTAAPQPQGDPNGSGANHREIGTASLFALFIGVGLFILGGAFLSVHRHSVDELASNQYASREQVETTYWLEHGYFRSAGLLFVAGPNLYRSVSGGYLVPGFVIQKLVSVITGHPNWPLQKLQNQVASMLASALLALLAFRIATRMGMHPFHAFSAAAALQVVYFTFPDNLLVYWEITGRPWWLIGAIVFLLADGAHERGRQRITLAVQAVAAFFLMYMEYVAGISFIASYLMLSFILDGRRVSWKRLVVTAIIPPLMAIAVFKGQIAISNILVPDVPRVGGTFGFRSGLDGSTRYYRDHLDIAYGRDVARANFQPEKLRPLFFHWPWLFYCAAVATVFVIVSAMTGRVPRWSVVSLLSLLGSYLIYASVFSQAVVIHPYYYDVMLFTPLMLALFVVTPALIEKVALEKGLTVVIVVFLSIWVSMVQMRRYAIMFPPAAATNPK